MTTLATFLTMCSNALGDTLGATWSTTTMTYWAKEAIREFPIARPRDESYTLVAAAHKLTLPTGFRELIWVEYPVNQDPPELLKYKSHLDPDFWGSEEYYDVDRDYTTEKGYELWTSALLPAASTIKVSYLCDHEEPAAVGSTLTVPDRYLNILMNYVIWRAYSERLAIQLQSPTAHTSLIQQFAQAAAQAKKTYDTSVLEALAELSITRTTPKMQVDGYDRIY